MGCRPADQVAAGEIIAAVSGFPGNKTNLPPTCTSRLPGCRWIVGWIGLPGEIWASDPGIRLIDPLSSSSLSH